MLGGGAGAPAPLLVGVGAPPLVARPVVVVRPPLFSSSLRRRRRRPPAVAAAAARPDKHEQGGRRRWWSDSDAEQQEEEDEEYDDDFFFTGSSSSSFGGELFDEPWFSKVFRTYGFLLPVMLASMLVATGPQAFLMAMAIPLTQSAVSFLIDAIWGRNGSSRRRRSSFQEEEDDDEDEFSEYSSSDFAGSRDSSKSSYYGGRRQSYQSWVSDDFAAAAAGASAGGADKDAGATKKGSFGGWDELLDKQDDGGKFGAGQATGRTRTAAADQRQGSPLSRTRRRGRMSASNKYKQAPLLMRLMVAVFPFLGSWFRLL